MYIFAVLWLTLLDRQWGERKAELVPFWEVRNLLENISIKYLRDFWLVQIFGNIAMFIPLGVLLPYLCGITKFKSVFLMSLCLFGRYRDNAVYHRQRAL
ncbi:MAG: VanZ family protein [Ruminococcus sp.]